MNEWSFVFIRQEFFWGWRNSTVVKSSSCSSRGPGFKSQHPRGNLQLSITRWWPCSLFLCCLSKGLKRSRRDGSRSSEDLIAFMLTLPGYQPPNIILGMLPISCALQSPRLWLSYVQGVQRLWLGSGRAASQMSGQEPGGAVWGGHCSWGLLLYP